MIADRVPETKNRLAMPALNNRERNMERFKIGDGVRDSVRNRKMTHKNEVAKLRKKAG